MGNAGLIVWFGERMCDRLFVYSNVKLVPYSLLETESQVYLRFVSENCRLFFVNGVKIFLTMHRVRKFVLVL